MVITQEARRNLPERQIVPWRRQVISVTPREPQPRTLEGYPRFPASQRQSKRIIVPGRRQAISIRPRQSHPRPADSYRRLAIHQHSRDADGNIEEPRQRSYEPSESLYRF